MVAISLYRGNLHRLPNGPRRWTIPTPKISPKDFKILTRRRDKALALLHLSSSSPATNTNPNHDPYADPDHNYSVIFNSPSDIENDDGTAEIEFALTEDFNEKKSEVEVEEGEWEKDGGECALTELVLDQTNDASVEEKNVNDVEIKKEPQSDLHESHNIELATSERDKMIKDIEGKLEVLNKKKHSLVQVLKLILSAEEQMKQNSVLATSLDVETTDSLSLNRVNTPCNITDGVETNDCLNENQQLPRMTSASPSPDSQSQRPVSDMVPYSNKSPGVAAVSPLHFGSGHPISTGTSSYIASSPSPAASGGTSAFRDVSPLN